MIAPPSTQQIRYGHSDEGWGSFDTLLRDTARNHALKRVIEIGGGANPSFTPDELRNLGLDYTLLDISAEELGKAPTGYHTVCADIAGKDFDVQGEYDFAFSRMLAEHVRDGARFHANVARLLRAGGYAVHFFPTMWAPPFVVNRLLPERAADRLLSLLYPKRNRHQQAKFPAYYDWCRGPSDSMIARFESSGYELISYTGYYGHREYYERLPLLRRLHERIVRWLIRHPFPTLTSFAVVVLRRV
jgi:SAM-dependent methyltransferase